MRINYAIVFVSDMLRSVAFYRDVIGLPLRFETSHWTEFATDGSTLALHVAEKGEPNDLDHEHPTSGNCRTGFAVDDIDSFHKRMTQNDVPCLQEPKEVFGSRVAQYADPDGMVFSVGETMPSSSSEGAVH